MANWLAQHLEQSDRTGWQVHMRDRNSVHVRRPDGLIEASIASRPMHYRNERGVWQPIDTGLMRSTRGRREYRADGVPVSVQADGLVSIIGSKHQQRTRRLVIFDVVKQQVVKTLAEFGDGIVVDDCLLRGSDAFQHTLQVLPDGLREDVTIRDAIGGTKASEWVMLETEIMGASWPDGWIKALPPVGSYRFPPPTARDATGRMMSASLYAQQRDGLQWLYSGVPMALMAALAFPVTLDPNFTVTSWVCWSGNSDVDYETAHSTYTEDFGTLTVGQTKDVKDVWSCYRPRLAFNTTSAVGVDLVGLVLRLAFSSSIPQMDDVVEITSLTGSSDYTDAVSATLQNYWQPSSFLGDTYYDSGGLDRTYLTENTTYYGLLTTNDRNAYDAGGSSWTMFTFNGSSYPPLLVVLYTVPSVVVIRHPGMAGGMNG